MNSIGQNIPQPFHQVIILQNGGGVALAGIRVGRFWKICIPLDDRLATMYTKITKYDLWKYDEFPTLTTSSIETTSEEENAVRVRYSCEEWEGGRPPPEFNFSLQDLLESIPS